ncbi:MAG TPA: hypothetical protein PL017_05075 [Tenuifilaceae bacterium]|nr:hypothetical protein [Tenuifilaceae bacterium]HPE18078.1 hypothetical protein [Tenuifilaceae bacterium]HPJ45448.1 hypothetical protein [Tenuifilaceae bacterium]HPQ34065.1 hypothetical protein [Tenuifilaceae bacterium]HRX68040.1 hypothetical protein [Tenuifilaceae bacterium]
MKTKITVIAWFCNLAIVLTSAMSVYSQDDAQYLLDLNRVKVSGFGNTNYVFSQVDGDFSYSSGGSGAFLFNYKYFVGIYGQNLETTHSRDDIYSSTFDPNVNPDEEPIFTKNKLHFNHGGLWLGYIHKPNSLVHWGTNLRLGAGRIALNDKDIEFHDLEEHHRDVIATIIPEFDVELNIARWFKVNLGIGYRFVLFTDNSIYRNSEGEDVRLYKSSQFSSPTATLKLMFGSFGPRPSKKNGHNIN